MTKKNRFGRRTLLGGATAATGGLLLQSIATGIPASVLLDPMSATAATPDTARTLILANSKDGDPVNANVPGMFEYGPTEIFHSTDPAMAETPLMLGTVPATAAKPWADLTQNILDRTCFFHHATYTPVHGEMQRVNKMMGATEKQDMLISLIARELAPVLGSVQSDPVSLGANGGELLSSEGRLLGNVSPLSVQKALGGVEGPLKNLTAMRDIAIDRIYAVYKERGTPSQRRLLDAWSRSRDEVRSISIDLIQRLDQIDGNNQINQIRTAAVLAAMNIAPVITIHLDFGRDNHTDQGFVNETTKHLSALADVQVLMDELDLLKTQGNLPNEVVFGLLNVFGRTLKRSGNGGRDHNKDHHAMFLMGDGINPGVVGGVHLNNQGTEYIAQSIDSATGDAAGDAGDITFEETLAAAGKTLGFVLGVSEERLDELLPPGKIVRSVCA